MQQWNSLLAELLAALFVPVCQPLALHGAQHTSIALISLACSALSQRVVHCAEKDEDEEEEEKENGGRK